MQRRRHHRHHHNHHINIGRHHPLGPWIVGIRPGEFGLSLKHTDDLKNIFAIISRIKFRKHHPIANCDPRLLPCRKLRTQSTMKRLGNIVLPIGQNRRPPARQFNDQPFAQAIIPIISIAALDPLGV